MHHNACNLYYTGVVGVAAGVVGDQAEADEDMSIQQRLALAGGSALGGAGEMVGDMTDVPLAGDALQVAGTINMCKKMFDVS